jgi:hypothetical protein
MSGSSPVLDSYITGSPTGSQLVVEAGSSFNFGASSNVGFCYDSPGVVDVNNGNCGNTTGSLKASTITAAAITTTSVLSLADGGEDTISFLKVGNHAGPGSGMVFEVPSGATMPAPAITAFGGGAIGFPSVGLYLGATGEYLYPGMTIQGWPTPQSQGCNPYCQENDTTFEDAAGNAIAGVQHPVLGALGHPFPFLIGATRTVTAASGDEGMYVGQLLIGDIVPAGTVEGPRILFQPGPSQTSPPTGPAFLGLGPESPTNNNFRFGHSGNEVSAWDDDGTYPTDVDVTGCWGVGIGNGSSFQGGGGVSWMGKLCPLLGGGFEVMNSSKTSDAPVKASFYRTVATTVANLATVDPSPTVGDRAIVTDAAACAFNSSVTGGGTLKCPVIYTGSWVAG